MRDADIPDRIAGLDAEGAKGNFRSSSPFDRSVIRDVVLGPDIDAAARAASTAFPAWRDMLALFSLSGDPEELINAVAKYPSEVKRVAETLRKHVVRKAMEVAAFAAQDKSIESFGGIEAALKIGGKSGGRPPPNEKGSNIRQNHEPLSIRAKIGVTENDASPQV